MTKHPHLLAYFFTIIAMPIAHAQSEGEIRFAKLMDAVAAGPEETSRNIDAFSKNCGPLASNPQHYNEQTQHIHNGIYQWAVLGTSNGLCVELFSPVQKTLTAQEASQFIHASQEGVPVLDWKRSADRFGYGPVLPKPSSRQVSVDLDSAELSFGSLENGKTLYTQSPERAHFVYQSRRSEIGSAYPPGFATQSYPTSTVAMLQNGNSSMGIATGSAVQVSPYVYATAAHNVIDRNTGTKYPEIVIFPGHNTSHSLGTGLKAAAVAVSPGYVGSTTAGSLATDLAFVKVNEPRFLSKYPPIHLIYTTADLAAGVAGVGDPLRDPFARTPNSDNMCQDSFNRIWAHSTSIPANKYCLYPGDSSWNGVTGLELNSGASSLGYPDYVGTIDNRFAHKLYYGRGLMGTNRTGQALMYFTGSDPVLGFQMEVSPGNSGGPVFGYVRWGNAVRAASLLGIVTNQINNGPYTCVDGNRCAFALASGMFNYNQGFWNQHLSWYPDYRFLNPTPYVYVPLWRASNYWTSYRIGVNAPGVDGVAVFRTTQSGLPPVFVGNFAHGAWINHGGTVGQSHTYRMYGLHDPTRLLNSATVTIQYDPR